MSSQAVLDITGQLRQYHLIIYFFSSTLQHEDNKSEPYKKLAQLFVLCHVAKTPKWQL